MKKGINKFLVAGVIIGMIFSLAGIALVAQAKSEPMERKIVVFQPWFVNESAKDELISRFGGAEIKNLDLIGGMAVYLPPKAEEALSKRTEVLRIDDDVIIEALRKPAPVQPAETLPWGVDRIDAEKVWGITTGDPIKVAIVDTGIDLTHPDLKDNIKGGVSTVLYTISYNDDNGHGTHVAGIVAAIDNEIGVIGVGPKIDLYAVKVLDRRGSGYLSDVIEGLDWAIKNGMQIVNMSFGASSYNASLEDAIKKVNAAGIVQVAAAGNSGPGDNTVSYPAKFAEVIAVTATDQTDTIASWSSRGSEVDLAAPGVDIYSTYKGSTYKTLSGTSMAAPHVTGTAALVLTTAIGGYDLDGDGLWDPNEVQNRLEATAKDLGVVGWDNLYGSGLVNAYSAVTE